MEDKELLRLIAGWEALQIIGFEHLPDPRSSAWGPTVRRARYLVDYHGQEWIRSNVQTLRAEFASMANGA